MKQEAFSRPAFTDGMLLHASDLEAQQAYDSGKRRLLSRALSGWGIVYGLEVRELENGVRVGAGLALDSQGREIHLPREEAVPLAQLFADGQPREGLWCLCISYHERPDGSAELIPQAGAPQAVPARYVESFSLAAKPSRQEDELCIAFLRLQAREGGLCCTVSSPVDGFHPSPLLPEPAPPPSGPGRASASGFFIVDLRERPSRSGVYYSEEIPHGLGPGEVCVTLAVRGWQDGRACAVSGDLELFQAQVRYAVKCYPEAGTFVAAVRSHEATGRHLRIQWYAQRMECAEVLTPPAPPAAPPEPPEKEAPFRIEPQLACLKPGETTRFSLAWEDRKWYGDSDFSADDGSIDSQGRYTAPSAPGFYRVRAQSRAHGEAAPALVLVRDGEAPDG